MNKIKINYLIILVIINLILFNGCTNNIYSDLNKIDPIEPLNRKIFIFNKITNDIILKPTIKIYNENIPYYIKDIINNFFFNLSVIPTVTNDILQGKIFEATNNSLRFIINTTLGCLGMFDIASKLHFLKNESCFLNTLVSYGYNTPFYLIIPFLGPSTLINLIGFVPDYFLNPQSVLSSKYKRYLFISISFNKKVQLLEKEMMIYLSSIDEYAFMRNAYLQYNKFNLNK